MLIQLINNSGISICMVGTPESIPFFEQAMQLARRSLGLQYSPLEFGEEFCKICERIWDYQYTRERLELTDGIREWLYEHCGGNISILVSIFHDAQETVILDGRDRLDFAALDDAYQKRMSMLHEYLEPSIRKRKQCLPRKKKNSACDRYRQEDQQETEARESSLAAMVKKTKAENLDIVEVLKRHLTVEEVSV